MSLEIGDRIRYKGRYLTAPDQYASNIKRLSQLPNNNYQLVILASPLLAEGLPEYIQQCNNTTLFICIDFEPVLENLLLDKKSKLISKQLRIIQHTSERNTEKLLEDIIYEHDIHTVSLLPMSGGFMLHTQRYYALLKLCNKIIRNHRQNKLTKRYFIRRWIKNLFANIIRMPDWESISIEKPVFLLGAGPSLEDWLSFLQEYRERIFLLVVDSVLPTLATCNLTPDLIIAQDAQIINCADLIPNHWAHTPVLADISAHPSIARQLPAAYFLSTFTPLKLLDTIVDSGMLTIPNLGSVGISAYYLIRRYYQGALFLAGMDMHYTPGKSHARLSAADRHHLAHTNRLLQGKSLLAQYNRHTIKGKDKYGNAVNVDVVLARYAELFSDLLQTDAKVWDLGHSGISLGIQQMKKDALLDYLDTAAPPSSTLTVPPYTRGMLLINTQIDNLETFLKMPDGDEKRHALLLDELSYVLDGETSERHIGYAKISAFDYLSFLKRQLLVFSRLKDRKERTLR